METPFDPPSIPPYDKGGRPRPSPPIRVFFLHRHHLFTEVLAQALHHNRRIQVVGVADELGGALRQLEVRQVDVVVVESDLDRSRLPAMIRHLQAKLPVPKVLPLGLDGDDEILACIEAGAAGFVPREASLADFIEILERVHGGSAHCSPQLAASIVARIAELSLQPPGTSPPTSAGTLPLTPRELEILKLIARGLRNQEIAEELGIALSTVKNHIHLMLRKLRVRNRREAIGRAWEIGLIDAAGPRPAPGPTSPTPPGASPGRPRSRARSADRETGNRRRFSEPTGW